MLKLNNLLRFVVHLLHIATTNPKQILRFCFGFVVYNFLFERLEPQTPLLRFVLEHNMTIIY